MASSALREAREEMIFEHCKWDPQVGDTDVLCPTPLVLRPEAAGELCALAEAMDHEIRTAESALVRDLPAMKLLGLPRSLRNVLADAPAEAIAAAPRVVRFDFHWTTEGWRVSEVNSDVPGGYVEAKGWSETVAPHYPGMRSTSDPVRALGVALKQQLNGNTRVALVHATAYTDDRQVMTYLARHWSTLGLDPLLAGPDAIRWFHSGPHTTDGEPLGAIFRFFPGEWLPNLGTRSGWQHFVRGATPYHTNPVHTLISQSKRFPIACTQLGLRLPTWDSLVPETRDPSLVPQAEAHNWVLKPALGRVGEGIGMADVTAQRDMHRITRAARRHHADWAAQRRFQAVPWTTTRGDLYPCLGVFVIAGRAAGIYGRASVKPLVDASAQDVAVLVASDSLSSN